MPQSLDKTPPPVAPAPARSARPAAPRDDRPFALPAPATGSREADRAPERAAPARRAPETGRDRAGTAGRDTAGTAGRDRAETARDRAGTERDEAGTARDIARRESPPPRAGRTTTSDDPPDTEPGAAAPAASNPDGAPAAGAAPDACAAGGVPDEEAGRDEPAAPADPTLAAQAPAEPIPEPQPTGRDAEAGSAPAAPEGGAGRAVPAGLAQSAEKPVAAAGRGEAAAGEGGREPEAAAPEKASFEPPRTVAEPAAWPATEPAPDPEAPAPGPAAPGLARAPAGQQPDPAPPPVVPQVPLGAVPVEIGLRSLAGVNRFEIRLDPAELGRIDVSLEIGEGGDVKAQLVVDRVETLALLQRDARTLERAFEQAGLKPSEGGVDLQLRDPSQDGRQPGRDGRGTERGPGAPRPAAPSAEAVPNPPPRRLWGGRVGVDVRI